jgi:hypothetical protein
LARILRLHAALQARYRRGSATICANARATRMHVPLVRGPLVRGRPPDGSKISGKAREICLIGTKGTRAVRQALRFPAPRARRCEALGATLARSIVHQSEGSRTNLVRRIGNGSVEPYSRYRGPSLLLGMN